MAVQPVQQLVLDKGTETGFIQFYNNMPQKPTTTVRVFDRNDYFTVHGEDAVLAAQLVFHTSSVIKHLGAGSQQLASVALSRMNFECFARELLLVRQYRVEVYRCKTKGSTSWSLAYKASPGNLQQLEEVVFGGGAITHTPLVLAVRLTSGAQGGRVVGVAYTDTANHVMGVTQFSDNDQLSELQACLVQLGPKECLLMTPDPHSDAGRLRQMLGRCGILTTDRKRVEFNAKDIVQDLNRLLRLEAGASSAALPQVNQLVAMECLSASISYLELLADEANFACYKLCSVDMSSHLRLDSSAAKALSLDPVPGEPPNSNLIGLLNKCHTPQGQRLLSQWVKQPLIDKSSIEERLDLVEAFVSDSGLRTSVQTELRHIPDLHRLSRRLVAHKASLQDCVRVYRALQRLPVLLSALSSHDGSHAPLLNEVLTTPLSEFQADCEKLVELVETTVDLDLVDHHEFVIKPSFDEGLQQLRREMDELEGKMQAVFRTAASELGLEPVKTIRLESSAQLGHFLRVTKKVEKVLRGQKRFSVLETRNDGVRFTNSQLRTLSQQYQALRGSYESAQASIVEEVLSVAGGYSEPLANLSSLLATVDVFTSFAHVSCTAPIPYVRPVITAMGEGDIELRGCRHPCLEQQDSISFIANDVSLIRGKDMFQIITGPNMGGKSTYIRQVGVAVLLAQVGCFVPCSSARVSVVDRILARVGAGDSQVKGVSTFMAEMLEAAAILDTATEHSLVIIDELGRGTSTYDGFGLAWAISHHIATKINCFCLFATHFHEMTALADEVETVSNRHVTALTTNEALTLLYRVQPGVCDQSFGLHVAELARFPARVVQFARERAEELESHHSSSSEEDAPSLKRQCRDRDGEADEVGMFLAAVGSLPLDELGEEGARDRLTGLVAQLQSSSCPDARAVFDNANKVV